MDKQTGDLEKIVSFLKEIRDFQLVYRFTPKPGGGFENDAEHSWSVALICMLLASRLEKEFGEKVDQLKILKMALIHDLAEIKAGDIKTWDKKSRIGKEEKERKAIKQLSNSLPVDLKSEMLELWEECEARESLEAKIVKSIDRFDPVLHRLSFEIGWKGVVEDEHATATALDQRQLPRHQFSQVLTTVYSLIKDEAIKKGMFKKV